MLAPGEALRVATELRSDLETARLELDRLVDAVWNGAAGSASAADRRHVLQLAGRDLAVKIFISGQIAGRPSMETLEQVIAAVSERVRGFPTPKTPRRSQPARGPCAATSPQSAPPSTDRCDRSPTSIPNPAEQAATPGLLQYVLHVLWL
jgi:hypothetical protein